jgi:hypothetical protein
MVNFRLNYDNGTWAVRFWAIGDCCLQMKDGFQSSAAARQWANEKGWRELDYCFVTKPSGTRKTGRQR